MKKKLMLSNTLIICVGFFAAFLFVILLIQNQYKQEFTKRLDAILAVMATQSDAIAENPQRFTKMESRFLQEANQQIRITILDLDGNVIGDSEQQSETDDDTILENHLNRPEIQQALTNGRGYDIRRSGSVSKPFYYAAIYLEGSCFLRAALPLSDLDYVTNQAWLYTFGCMLFGISLVCLFTWLMVGRFIEPIQKLTCTAHEIAAGNFAARIQDGYRDEVGELASSFNVMAGNTETAVQELKNQQQQLQDVLQGMDSGVLAADGNNNLLFLNQSARQLLQNSNLKEESLLEGSLLICKIAEIMRRAVEQNVALHETVTESGREERQFTVYAAPLRGQVANSALAVLNDVTHIRKLEQIRSEFVANVTHELKTPLTSIRGSIELLKSANRDEETRMYFYDVLDIEAERLHHLIDDMLVLSQIENAKEDPSIRKCILQEELQKTIDRLLPVAEKNSVSIELDADSTLCVSCSPTRIQQLFGNLIENALKYNKPDGKVFLTAIRQRQMAVVKIRDTGIGIPQEHIPRLFERFYRVDTSRSREIGGTGLGLSIVKHLAALYHGEVSVESVAGEGTVFTIRLPLTP